MTRRRRAQVKSLPLQTVGADGAYAFLVRANTPAGDTPVAWRLGEDPSRSAIEEQGSRHGPRGGAEAELGGAVMSQAPRSPPLVKEKGRLTRGGGDGDGGGRRRMRREGGGEGGREGAREVQ